MVRGGRLMVVVAMALSIVTPSAASAASVPPADDAVDVQALRWAYCRPTGNPHVIFRRTGSGCTDGFDSVGFVALTWQPGGYRLQVCATRTDTIAMRVDPADASGGSTGNIITYFDDPYGPCYNRDIGYPVRKFQMVHLWVLGADFSLWMDPPPS
jgi:hypothetical protein